MMNRVCTLTNSFVILMMVALATKIQAAPVGSCLDPRDYKALANANGTLSSSGSITFDTTALTMNGVTNGVLVTNESGNVVLAFFPYSSVDIQAGATVTVMGNRGLALGSLSTMIVSATVTNNGLDATGIGPTAVRGQGGSGGEDGVTSTSYNSTNQTSNRALGGATGGGAGKGYGGGGAHPGVNGAGAGGGYGGAGGSSSVATGGPSYGDPALTNLYGGSGGSGSMASQNQKTGGGGGGSIELTAVVSITIGSGVTIGAMGGAGGGPDIGGGGSGGGILLCAPKVFQNGTLNARGGGNGAANEGGGGGGGRIAIYANQLSGTQVYNVSAGSGGSPAAAAGTYTNTVYPFAVWYPGTVIKFH
jgi:hypothetical protein